MPLYKRDGSSHWWVRLGRKTRLTTGTADREKAKEFEEQLKERLWRQHKLGDRGAVPWNQASERWLRDSKRKRSRDREILKWLKPKIGNDMVSAVSDPDAIDKLRELGLADGWSHSTVDRAMRTISSVLRKCVKWRYLATLTPVSMYGEEETEPRYLTQPQFRALVKQLPPHLKLAARFAVLTLLRMRSQSRLTWDRIDLRAGRAWVPGAQMKGRGTHGLPLSQEAVKVLRLCKTMSPKGARVFQFEGRPIDNFNTAAFKKAVRRAKLPPIRWHDLRHTGASWAVQSGVTLPELMVLGGWKSYRSVLRYAHLAPSNAASAAEKVAQSLVQRSRRTVRRK